MKCLISTLYITLLPFVSSGKSTNQVEDLIGHIEVEAEYPGGKEALIDELYENLVYPDSAKEKNIEGTLYVRFYINENGTIGNVEAWKDIGGGCGQAAIEAIKQLSKPFKPATKGGKPVKIYYTLPVNFSLKE